MDDIEERGCGCAAVTLAIVIVDAIIIWALVSIIFAAFGAPVNARDTHPVATLAPITTPAPSVRIPIGTLAPIVTMPPTDTD